MGYHVNKIPKGIHGEISKVQEVKYIKG